MDPKPVLSLCRELALWALLMATFGVMMWRASDNRLPAVTPCACCEGEECTCRGNCTCKSSE